MNSEIITLKLQDWTIFHLASQQNKIDRDVLRTILSSL